jgi:Tol biopolymer transport system component
VCVRDRIPFQSSALFLTITAISFLGLGAPLAAEAQYFGRNKVQYKPFHFEMLETEHFHVYFYSEEREAAGELARMAERWYARLAKIFGSDLSTVQPIVVYASGPDFRQTNVISGEIGEGTGGVTEGAKRRIVLPLAGSLQETDHVLGHELVHAFQYDMARTDPNKGAGAGIERLPLWFIEGMAEYLSVGPVDAHTAMWIRDAAREGGKLPSIDDLSNPQYFPYRWGQALWAYVAGRWGDAVVEQALEDAVRSGSATGALERITGLKDKELTEQWHAAIKQHYGPVLNGASRASAVGRLLTADQKGPGSLAVSPALSPDGTRIAYLSERDLLSVDLYLADATTGRVIRKLVNTSVDPHFSSIQFIASAGTWRPDGRQFAFAAISKAVPELVIVDVDKGERVREIPFKDLGEILNPTWSPDGRAIAFSAMTGGRTDLFIYDLQAGTTRRLTADAFADMQPAWSPAGDRIAFVTDRFSTDLPRLAAGQFDLALIDVATGRVDPVRAFERGKHINPQWAPGGRTLFFLSDVTGVTNAYALEMSSGRLSRLTNLDAGASGITALSPALSSASDSNRLAFSGYEDGRIGLYLIDGHDALKGTAVTTTTVAGAGNTGATPAAAVLPPSSRADDEVTPLLNDADTGLATHAGTEQPYRARLSLDGIGQPYISAGVDRFGGMYGGGLWFSLSDMLGNHNLFAAVDLSTYGSWNDFYRNTAGMVAYQNLEHRWNWGIGGGQRPYLAGGFASGTTSVNGQPAIVEQEILQRQTYRGAQSAVAYPFSETTRVEFGGGYQQVSFDQRVRTIVTSIRTGQTISDTTETTSLADTLHLGETTMALVFDAARFGATSPVSGYRSRFEISPTAGSLFYTGALADYRRYDMPSPFITIASRIMHYGRYGRDSENTMLLPFYIGYPELIRGYDINSFRSSECTAGPAGTCDVFDRLLGSRMLIGNLELRMPLLRAFGVRSSMYGPLPVEVAFFTDAGVAWTSDNRPTFFGGDRRPVSSAGVSFRANLFGFAVGQFDLAYPFQRPGRGWVWGFSLTPGF